MYVMHLRYPNRHFSKFWIFQGLSPSCARSSSCRRSHRSSQKKKHTHAKACPSGEIPRRSLQARTAGANPPESVSPTPFKTHQPRTAWCLSVRVFLSGGKRPQKQPRESWKNWKNSSSLSQQTTIPSRRKSRKIEKSRVGKGGQADHTAATTSAKRRDGAKKKRSAKIVRRPGGVGGGSPGGGRRRFGAEIPCGQPSRHEHL